MRRLYAMMLFVCSSVCLFVSLFVCRRNAYTKTQFSQKLSNLELFLLTTNRKSQVGFLLDP